MKQIVTKQLSGGVCAPQGFRAAGVQCGLRKRQVQNDLALIVSDVAASAAAVYTQNLVQGAPLTVTKEHLQNGKAQAIICNSGNANTCNADGILVAKNMCAFVEQQTGIPATDVIVASTGVIGQPLPVDLIQAAMPALALGLTYDNSDAAARAIMTTDLAKKEVAVEFTLSGKVCKMGGIAKGSGMIHPNMATMLVFITTDAAISPAMLQAALSEDILDTYNMVSVDGDTSTNDMVTVLANGLAGNPAIENEGTDYDTFCAALRAVNSQLCKAIAKDGEGATKTLTCEVVGAKTALDARKAAKSIICSSLFKSAMFGADANWGRALAAIGYAGADVEIGLVELSFASPAGQVDVCKFGAGIPFSEKDAKAVLLESEITILVNLHSGEGKATAWGCDLTYDYVKINGDYRS